jgi:F0F1-type ATP synthase membrane subunit c/vacuolar-type H+-ATPase subunit K
MFQNGLALSGAGLSSGLAQGEAVQAGDKAENTQAPVLEAGVA